MKLNYIKWFQICLIISLVIFSALTVRGEEGKDKKKETNKPDIRVTNIVARVSPQTEIILPAGSITEHFKHNFNNFWIIFNFYYNFMANEISGDLTFEYPFLKFNSYITFMDNVDFENFIQPSIKNNQLTLVPTSKYISRNRIIKFGLDYKLNKNTKLFSNFTIDDLFKGDLISSVVIDEGIDLITTTGLTFNNIKEARINDRLLFKGIYYKASINLKSRDKLTNFVSMDFIQNFLLKTGVDKYWALDQKINMGFPIKVWVGPLASYYSMGGFESLRGFREQSIDAFRFLSASTTIHRKLLKKNKIKKRVAKSIIYLHLFNIYVFYDQCITQDNLPLNSPINYYSSIGTGLSFVISTQKAGHLKISTFVAQALKKDYKPVLYFKTSFF